MPSPPENICSECKWFSLTDEEKQTGECRRFPPTDKMKGINLDKGIFGWYPVVKGDWVACAESDTQE